MKSRDVAHQVVKAIACHPSGAVQINAVKALHDVGVVGDLEIRNYRLAVLLHLHVLAVVLSDGNAGIDDVGNGHHDLFDLLLEILLLLLQLGKAGGILVHLLL